MSEDPLEEKCGRCGYDFGFHSSEDSLCPKVKNKKIVYFYKKKKFLKKKKSRYELIPK